MLLVPQGSILDPLLSNVYLYALLYFLEDCETKNYANDSTPFSADKNHDLDVWKLEQLLAILFKWLKNNYINVNTDKSHFLLSGETQKASHIDGNVNESENLQFLWCI